jgi:tRNA dimethylallyltransferase
MTASQEQVQDNRERFIPLLALVGPTATGKTALALALAERLSHSIGVEVVSADSRQIYRLMDIATAKPTAAQRALVTHHLLNRVWPDESFTLAEYQAAASAAIADIWARGKLPLLVGGTGLYVRAVVDGLAIPEVAPQPELRAELEAVAATDGAQALHARLAALDPAAAAHMDTRGNAGNVRRLVRALEVCIVSGQPFSAQQRCRPVPYRPLLVGLNMERAALYARADARVDTMLESGLVAETEALIARGYGWHLPAMSSLGYRELGAYLRAELALLEAVTRFKLATHKYIRRQLTWFRPDGRITWFDAAQTSATLAEKVAAMALPWLRTG